MQYHNPILPGFHPDPTICAVGGEYYLVTSTFEYFPGLPIYHSKDMLHWEQIGHALTRTSQCKLVPGAPNCINIYAPCLRYHEGVYYLIVTCVTGDNRGNFILTTTDPAGEWSEPIALDFPGIDPSLFFDEDGKVYYIGTDGCIYLQEINVKTGERIGELHYVWNGTANNPEGPHLYKVDGWYYLLIAQGGTEMCHQAALARSKSLFGEWEACPHNPIITNISTCLPIKAAGHADLVQDAAGQWWAVCLGIRPLSYPFVHNLGRETMLVPVKWENGWPICGTNGHVEVDYDVDNKLAEFTPTKYIPGSDTTDALKMESMADLHHMWNIIYNPTAGIFHPTVNGLEMESEVALSEDKPKAWLGRRQEHIHCQAEVTVTQESGEAGLSVYMNPYHHYEAIITKQDGKTVAFLRRQIGSMVCDSEAVPCEKTVRLRMKSNVYCYNFYLVAEDGTETDLGCGETRLLTTEAGGCFTGNYVALFASKGKAKFTDFAYKAVEEK